MAELTPLTASQANDLVEGIRRSFEAAWQHYADGCGLLIDAYRSQAWKALGLADWSAFVSHTLDVDHLRIPRAERQAIVAALSEGGLSVRAIATATGLSVGTVQGSLTAGRSKMNTSPVQDIRRLGPTVQEIIARLMQTDDMENEDVERWEALITDTEEFIAEASQQLEAGQLDAEEAAKLPGAIDNLQAKIADRRAKLSAQRASEFWQEGHESRWHTAARCWTYTSDDESVAYLAGLLEWKVEKIQWYRDAWRYAMAMAGAPEAPLGEEGEFEEPGLDWEAVVAHLGPDPDPLMARNR